ncbi:MAG: hypothetical protein KDD61_16715 [Bdellovibrionales bacterium]|nr:hypothetical protein [Bdellovibrionales bacterium]
MIHWTEVAVHPAIQRYQLLSQFLKSEHQIENEVEFLQGPAEQFQELLHKAMKTSEFVRIGTGFGESVVREFPFSSERISILKTADVLLPSGEKWWTRSATFHGVQKCLGEASSGLDTEKKVLIAGAGALSRAVIAALVKMGFKEFNITNYQEEPVVGLIKDIQKHYFGIKCRYVPMENLILLSGNHSVLANTTPYLKENVLLNELYYLNYLQTGGIVIDFNLNTRDTPLVQEARAVYAKVIEGYQIASWADAICSKWTFGVELNREEYNRQLREVIDVCPPIKDPD